MSEADTSSIVQEYLHSVKGPSLTDPLTRQCSTPKIDDESSNELPSLQDSPTTNFSEDQRSSSTFRSTDSYREMQTTYASAVFHRQEPAHHFTTSLRTSSTHHLLRDLNHERKLTIRLNNATQTADANAVKTQRVFTLIDLTDKYADRLDATKILCSASIRSFIMPWLWTLATLTILAACRTHATPHMVGATGEAECQIELTSKNARGTQTENSTHRSLSCAYQLSKPLLKMARLQHVSNSGTSLLNIYVPFHKCSPITRQLPGPSCCIENSQAPVHFGHISYLFVLFSLLTDKRDKPGLI